jgi:hypothetical protein
MLPSQICADQLRAIVSFPHPVSDIQICENQGVTELREALSHPYPVTATGASPGETIHCQQNEFREGEIESGALPSQFLGEIAKQIESEAVPSQLPQVVSEVNLCESAAVAPPEISERFVIKHFSESEDLAKSQQGGPRPGRLQADQRSCQSDFPKATGPSLGWSMPLRTLSIQKTSDVTKIWEEAERRLGASRANFSLVRSGSRYLPRDGTLESPEQLFEIRWQGRGGGPRDDDWGVGDAGVADGEDPAGVNEKRIPPTEPGVQFQTQVGVIEIQQPEKTHSPGKRRWTIRRVEPKDQCHSSDKAQNLLVQFNRMKRALRAKTYALQDWFRNGIQTPKVEAEGKSEKSSDSKVSVTVYLEDPGGHTHCATRGYQMLFDTQKERPKHFFWKKLVRTFRLKGLYWDWQGKISETDWATLRELVEPEDSAIYRVFIKGKRNKHANRPGKGRRAQRKAKNFQNVWRPPAEHNVNVGTMTRSIGNSEGGSLRSQLSEGAGNRLWKVTFRNPRVRSSACHCHRN